MAKANTSSWTSGKPKKLKTVPLPGASRQAAPFTPQSEVAADQAYERRMGPNVGRGLRSLKPVTKLKSGAW